MLGEQDNLPITFRTQAHTLFGLRLCAVEQNLQ
jgi:hypothetical protein